MIPELEESKIARSDRRLSLPSKRSDLWKTNRWVQCWKCTADAKAMQVMIDNNLSFEIAYPYEFVTYGETGFVCANWMQYNLTRNTWKSWQKTKPVVESSPSWPSNRNQLPCRHWLTVSLIGEYDNMRDWEIQGRNGRYQLRSDTAGGWMYIGPQGMFTIPSTPFNAGRVSNSACQMATWPVNSSFHLVSVGWGAQGKQLKSQKRLPSLQKWTARSKPRHSQGWISWQLEAGARKRTKTRCS